MLTFVDAISIAGDRKKQNDDAYGFADGRAWILDGATDLHDAPLCGYASDAAWIAHVTSAYFHGATGGDLRKLVREASRAAANAFATLTGGKNFERWRSPISSLVLLEESETGVRGLDLGDSRLFALDADGALHVRGGAEGGRDAEAAAAAKQTDADKPLLQRAATIDMLRRNRAAQNQPGAHWTFGFNPDCADYARSWELSLARPAHLLLMTDGFAVLADQYGVYDEAGLVRAALDKGVHELARELRAVENADELGVAHPRFKKSDDATAVLLRLT